MSINTKKFLDQSGTSYLWQKITEALAAKGRVDSVTAADQSITISGTSTAPTVGVHVSSKAGNILSVQSSSGEEGLYVPTFTQVEYGISKAATADAGYATTYHLTANGVITGTAINVPKDMVVSSGQVETKSTTGAWGEPGTYLHLVLANADNSNIYINVSDLIEYVTSGSSNGDMIVINIDSSSHQVTATITDGTITKAKLASGVQSSLNLADTALQSNDIAEGTTNGAISVKGNIISVHGLGSAAYSASTAFDSAGAATEVYNAIVALSNSEIDAAIASANSNS